MSELVLYTSDDGLTRLDLRVEGQTVWLTQLEIAELFQTTKQNASLHAKNIFEDGELTEDSVVKESLTTTADDKRYKTKLYNLDLILTIGYRVRSPRGVQFRQWASAHLKEYLVKGFVMDDERLKNPGGWDYFDELLARIREKRRRPVGVLDGREAGNEDRRIETADFADERRCFVNFLICAHLRHLRLNHPNKRLRNILERSEL